MRNVGMIGMAALATAAGMVLSQDGRTPTSRYREEPDYKPYPSKPTETKHDPSILFAKTRTKQGKRHMRRNWRKNFALWASRSRNNLFLEMDMEEAEKRVMAFYGEDSAKVSLMDLVSSINSTTDLEDL